MLEETPEQTWFCNICAHEWGRPNADAVSRADAAADRHPADDSPRYGSVEALISASGVRRDELATLAEIGALNSIPGPSGDGHHRRSALWQIERAVRPSGELFKEERWDRDWPPRRRRHCTADRGLPTADADCRPRTATADPDCRPPTADCRPWTATADRDCRPPTADCRL